MRQCFVVVNFGQLSREWPNSDEQDSKDDANILICDKSFVVSIFRCLISNANNNNNNTAQQQQQQKQQQQQQQQKSQQQQQRQPSGKNYFAILTDISTPSPFSRNPETNKQSITFIVREQQ